MEDAKLSKLRLCIFLCIANLAFFAAYWFSVIETDKYTYFQMPTLVCIAGCIGIDIAQFRSPLYHSPSSGKVLKCNVQLAGDVDHLLPILLSLPISRAGFTTLLRWFRHRSGQLASAHAHSRLHRQQSIPWSLIHCLLHHHRHHRIHKCTGYDR